MIRSIRKAHRLAFLALALCLPLLFAGGLLSRHTWPRRPNRIEEQTTSIITSAARTIILGGLKLEVRLFVDQTNPAASDIQITLSSPLVAPNVLVYWSEIEAKSVLSADALFLGAFRNTGSYRLPAKANGYAILSILPQNQHQSTFHTRS